MYLKYTFQRSAQRVHVFFQIAFFLFSDMQMTFLRSRSQLIASSFVSRVHYSRRSSCIVSHLMVIAGSDCSQVEGQREKETRGRGAHAGKLLGRRDRIINVVRLCTTNMYTNCSWRIACGAPPMYTRTGRYVHSYCNAIINKANRSSSLSFSHLVTCFSRAEPIRFVNRHEFTCRLQGVA